MTEGRDRRVRLSSSDGAGSSALPRRSVRALARLVRRAGRAAGLIRSAPRPRVRGTAVTASPETCIVCGQPAAQVVRVTDRSKAGIASGTAKTFDVRICSECGHVGNPSNVKDYATYGTIDRLPMRARVGTLEHEGREYHMAQMAVEILARPDLDVLVYGAGRSLDNLHIEGLHGVRAVAIGDVMRLREDADFIDITRPASRRFPVVIASEVIEHFLDPRVDFPHMLEFLEPDGLLVCSTSMYDGRDLSNQRYLFLAGHTSYYSERSLRLVVERSRATLDLRTPLVATGYAGSRKRYALITSSATVRRAVADYFATREYAPSEAPWADLEMNGRSTSRR
jgi:Methyltransferase domain